jgi:hypothetical protein
VGSNPTSTAKPQFADLRFCFETKIKNTSRSQKWSRNVRDLETRASENAGKLLPSLVLGKPARAVFALGGVLI